MKKLLLSLFIAVCVFGGVTVYASDVSQAVEKNGISENSATGQLIQIKEKAEKEIEDYTKLYGSKAYGMAGYILNKIRIYSIPFCLVGVAVGAIYQYVIGVRRLDVRDKGLMLTVMFVTVLVICQVLPLVFAIVVRGWRG